MKIAINGLSARFGGGAAYMRNLLEHLSIIDRENEYIIFTNPERESSLVAAADSPNFRVIAPGFPGSAIARRSLWEQMVLPVFIRRQRVDVLFSPGGIAPVNVPDPCRQVNLVQNMAPFSDELLASYPLSRRKMRFLMLQKLYPFFAARADANIFISRAGRDRLLQLTGIDDRKCRMIYHGRDETFMPVPQDAAESLIEAKYGISGGFVLYVSNIARYKKQKEVVEAYSIIRRQGAHIGRLVLAGIMLEPSYYREVMNLAHRLNMRDEVTYLGRVPQADLPHLYSAASVFVFASICENCPNILIEAMGCGAPIVSSNREPMPEICGNAALYFDPTEPSDIADRIWRVLTDETIRRELIRNAQEEVNRFSWERSARETLRVFEEVMVIQPD